MPDASYVPVIPLWSSIQLSHAVMHTPTFPQPAAAAASHYFRPHSSGIRGHPGSLMRGLEVSSISTTSTCLEVLIHQRLIVLLHPRLAPAGPPSTVI